MIDSGKNIIFAQLITQSLNKDIHIAPCEDVFIPLGLSNKPSLSGASLFLPMEQSTKICKKCGRELPIDAFSKRRYESGNYGYEGQCKECRRRPEYQKEWREKHPYYRRKGEYLKMCPECRRNFMTHNPNQSYCSESCRLDYTKPGRKLTRYLKSLTPEERKKIYQERYINKYGKEHINERRKEYRKLYRETHRNEYNKRRAEYRKRYKEKNGIGNVYYYKKKRLDTDVSFRFVENLRKKLYLTLRGYGKYNSTLELLGCSVDEARQYIESQFTKNMTWDNWGIHGWHIDHVIPISYFNLEDPDQQRQCFHYTNLRPLWGKENIRKSNKIIEQQLKII